MESSQTKAGFLAIVKMKRSFTTYGLMTEKPAIFSRLGIFNSDRIANMSLGKVTEKYLRKLTELRSDPTEANAHLADLLTKEYEAFRGTNSNIPPGAVNGHNAPNVLPFTKKPMINTQIGIGAALAVTGLAFSAHATSRISRKNAEQKTVTLADRLYQGVAYAGTGAAALLTAALYFNPTKGLAR